MEKKTHLGTKIYSDLKKTILVLLVITFVSVILASSYFAYEKYSNYINEKRIIDKAVSYAEGKKPAEFFRTDLGDIINLQVWDINDSDQHLLVKVNGLSSVFTQSVQDTYVRLNHVAGKACYFAEAEVKDGKVTAFSCDGKIYDRKK
ncbi:hypothetical protein CYR32_01675 [Chimaeribacter coloradensis]|uniref:Uncharacterized protein n=1 Tax=Chimaeribacter coloradensis TaxID=2060068 RepID=A0A2N5ED74_9GAMM|nr:hypothetical protein [Chimaeribacter coloradensis]PLR40479.1 hypothetical protein CYR32_01675 [Chimaeribacter coloradensis]